MAVRFTRILVPLDSGTASDAALVCAKELAAKFGSRLFLLHIVEDPIATGAWTPDVYIAASAGAARHLAPPCEAATRVDGRKTACA